YSLFAYNDSSHSGALQCWRQGRITFLKMDVVKVTFSELEEIARRNKKNNGNNQNSGQNIERRDSKQDKSKKTKRPERGIYRPPTIHRLKQDSEPKNADNNENSAENVNADQNRKSPQIPSTENWEEVIDTGIVKDSSEEKEAESITQNLQKLDISKSSSEDKERKIDTNETRRRSKRPSLQIYVPKGKILEQQEQKSHSYTGKDEEEEEVWDVDDNPETETSQSSNSPLAHIVHQDMEDNSPRKVDLKNMQVTVVNDIASQQPKGRGRGRSRTSTQTWEGVTQSKNPDIPVGRGRRVQQALDKESRSQDRSHQEGMVKQPPSNFTVQAKTKAGEIKEMYIVPVRPDTIGQEASRNANIIGQEENETSELNEKLDVRLEKLRANKSRSVEKLDISEKWDEEDFYDIGNIGTLVFERSRSSEQLNLTENKVGLTPMYKGKGSSLPRKFSFAAMRRAARKESVSSDVSTGTGSDWSVDELEDSTAKILDWNKEVERELALQVQDETQKLNEWFAKQSDENNSFKANPSGWQSPNMTRSLEVERQTSEQKARCVDSKQDKNQPRGRKKDRRRGSLDVRSRDSSVRSVQSVQSVHSVQSAYGDDDRRRHGGRRRRRRRSGSTNFGDQMQSESSDPRNINIKVTCAGNNKREVMLQDKNNNSGRRDGGGLGRHRRNSYGESSNKVEQQESKDKRSQGYQKRSEELNYLCEQWRKSDRSHRDKYVGKQGHDGRSGHSPKTGPPPKGGGLLHLPPQSSLNNESHHTQERHAEKKHPRDRVKEHAREGSGQGQKVLFDPKNPDKPIVISKSSKLEFKDEDDPPAHITSYPPAAYPRGYGPIYPGYNMGYGQGNPYERVQPHHGITIPMDGPYGYSYPMPPYPEPGVYPDDTYTKDPCYHSDYGQQDQFYSGGSRSQCRMMVENALRQALPLENQLSNLISHRVKGEEGFKMLNLLRHNLQSLLEQIVLLDPDFSNKHNVEQMLWKSVFYQIIEVLRKQFSEEKDDDTKHTLHAVLDEGTAFYEMLLKKLQKTYDFSLDVFLDTNSIPPENINRAVKLALLSAQRSMICLGDIARYREQMNDSGKVNYGKSRSWYTKAQQIAPKNGRPYNQLAILALYTRRKLDAVYYYMRSLAASNPFLTARESLMSLFDEAGKKVLAVEKKRLEEKLKQQQQKKAKQSKSNHQHNGHRVEIWIHSDGSTQEDEVADNEEEDLSKLDAVELNKRFVLSFLNVHGKLFTKIGMEMFPEVCGQMLLEFQALLKDGAISPTRLLQLTAINMFAIENTALKDQSLEGSCHSLLQEYAVQMGLDMFGILLKHCSSLLQMHVQSTEYPSRMFSRELEELVPGIKIWTDWMMCHSDLWNPPPAIRDPSFGPDVDVWVSTAELCNILKDMDTSLLKLYSEKKEGCDAVLLSEDMMMAGFVPLLSAPTSTSYVHSTVDKEIARACVRIEKLSLFGEYLCGIEPPMLAFNVESRKYYSVAPSQGYESQKDEEKQSSDKELSEEEEEEVVIESEEEQVLQGDVGEEHVQHLKARREELQKKVEQQAKQQENLQKLLEKNRHRLIELEIRPLFLVADTNCFIDHLSSIVKLLRSKRYTIVVPLVVISELDGLCQGSREGQYVSVEHGVKVKAKSKEAITLLEEEFEKKNSHLKAQTSKGSVLDTIAFRAEETDSSGNNDDLVLSCCLHYCKDKARDFMPKDKDSPVRLYRDVVLLTDDRNLRLKAHTCNVPVKDVPSFIKWSKIT
ncbi:hypothetical protein ACJMK2_010974, partial [Sinanodonta woodiana]